MKRNKIILILPKSNTKYKSKLVIKYYMFKYKLVCNLGVVCATGWNIMSSWESFTKYNRCY